jgi:chaperonin GroES
VGKEKNTHQKHEILLCQKNFQKNSCALKKIFYIIGTLSKGVPKKYVKALIIINLKQTTQRRKEMNIRPLADRVVIKPLEDEDKSPGGIILPDTAKEKPMRGEVTAVGAGKLDDNGKRQPMDVKKGDVVLYGKYSGTDIKINNEDYLIVRESDILAIVEK